MFSFLSPLQFHLRPFPPVIQDYFLLLDHTKPFPTLTFMLTEFLPSALWEDGLFSSPRGSLQMTLSQRRLFCPPLLVSTTSPDHFPLHLTTSWNSLLIISVVCFSTVSLTRTYGMLHENGDHLHLIHRCFPSIAPCTEQVFRSKLAEWMTPHTSKKCFQVLSYPNLKQESS